MNEPSALRVTVPLAGSETLRALRVVPASAVSVGSFGMSTGAAGPAEHDETPVQKLAAPTVMS